MSPFDIPSITKVTALAVVAALWSAAEVVLNSLFPDLEK